jgi:rhamnulose-1-phosphate aldolase
MKEILEQNTALQNLAGEMAEVAGYLWQRGWAERNAGNISVNISDLFQDEIPETSAYTSIDLSMAYPKLAGCSFLVTGTGKRMRDLARNPSQNAVIIKMNESGSRYQLIPLKADADTCLPTSELPTHLGIHQMIAERGSDEKVVMHTHANELVALTHAKEFCNQEELNRLLWSMHPETAIFVPEGVGFVPYTVPGSESIAAETTRTLHNHDVAIWEKHGVFAIGKEISATFDLIDILAKSARIYFMCRSANIEPGRFSDAELVELKLLSLKF